MCTARCLAYCLSFYSNSDHSQSGQKDITRLPSRSSCNYPLRSGRRRRVMQFHPHTQPRSDNPDSNIRHTRSFSNVITGQRLWMDGWNRLRTQATNSRTLQRTPAGNSTSDLSWPTSQSSDIPRNGRRAAKHRTTSPPTSSPCRERGGQWTPGFGPRAPWISALPLAVGK